MVYQFCAWFICLLVLMGAGTHAHAKTPPVPPSKSALIVPARLQHPELAELVLSHQDAKLYARYFTALARGQKGRASAIARQLEDTSLTRWHDARARMAQQALWPTGIEAQGMRIYRTSLPRDAAARQAAKKIQNAAQTLLKADELEKAERLIHQGLQNGQIDRIEGAMARADLAGAYLYDLKPDIALKHARLALQIAATKAPRAAWVAGLASWLKGDFEGAARYFARMQASSYASPKARTGAAYWCARALARNGANAHEVKAWLALAASNQRSFYGLLATQALGSDFVFEWAAPSLDANHIATLKAMPGAVRALKLAQAGQADLARIELAMLDGSQDGAWQAALRALIAKALVPAQAIKVAHMLEVPSIARLDAALYPTSPWQPADGYRLEPALLHAFVRQESAFNPMAINRTSGAMGLMQLLPRTARSMQRGVDARTLQDPAQNMALGQKYIERLLERHKGNLFDMAIAYNAGPTNLARWHERLKAYDDPLVFLELVPYGQTRAYTKRIMSNYWIYSLRMGTQTALGALEQINQGKKAIYAGFTPNDSGPIYALVGANAH